MAEIINLRMEKGTGLDGVKLVFLGVEYPVKGLKIEFVGTDDTWVELETPEYEKVRRQSEKAREARR